MKRVLFVPGLILVITGLLLKWNSDGSLYSMLILAGIVLIVLSFVLKPKESDSNSSESTQISNSENVPELPVISTQTEEHLQIPKQEQVAVPVRISVEEIQTEVSEDLVEMEKEDEQEEDTEETKATEEVIENEENDWIEGEDDDDEKDGETENGKTIEERILAMEEAFQRTIKEADEKGPEMLPLDNKESFTVTEDDFRLVPLRVCCPVCNHFYEILDASETVKCTSCFKEFKAPTEGLLQIYRPSKAWNYLSRNSVPDLAHIFVNGLPYGDLKEDQKCVSIPVAYGPNTIHITTNKVNKCRDKVVDFTPENSLHCFGFMQYNKIKTIRLPLPTVRAKIHKVADRWTFLYRIAPPDRENTSKKDEP